METNKSISGNSVISSFKAHDIKKKFYDITFLISFLCCLVPGIIPALTGFASVLMILCIVINYKNDNFYLYAALFMYMRYIMLIGDTPVYRVYSYLVALKFMSELFKTKFRIAYLPAVFVIVLHSIFALPPVAGEFFDDTIVRGVRVGLNVIVDIVLVYLILLKVLEKADLFRKFLYVFLMGGVASGIYGWFNPDVSVDINISGAGVHTVNRNFGALNDSNFAGIFYSLCIIGTIALKGIPKLVKAGLTFIFLVLILQTASLSALLVLFMLFCFYIILKYRIKSVFILSGVFLIGIVVLALLLAIPQFRQLDMIAGLIIRIEEKLSYIPRGRWDLLTTDRTALWSEALKLFANKSIWGKLIGGSVITIVATDYSAFPAAIHNSYLQSLLNFGIIGTILIYLPLFAVFFYRLCRHFANDSGYANEDIKIMQMIFSFVFIVFGATVDFFVDWTLMIFYFI